MALGPWAFTIPSVYGPWIYDVSFDGTNYTIDSYKGTIKSIVKEVFIKFTQNPVQRNGDLTFTNVYPFTITMNSPKNEKCKFMFNGVNNVGLQYVKLDIKELLKEINQEFEKLIPLIPFS